MSSSLQSHELHLARLPCPSPSPRAYSNLCPSSWWCHKSISSFVVPFSCLQSFPASGTFPKSQLFASACQSIGAWAWASPSVLPVHIQDWFPSGLTSLMSLLSKGLLKVFSSTIVWKYQFFSAKHSLWSTSHISYFLELYEQVMGLHSSTIH